VSFHKRNNTILTLLSQCQGVTRRFIPTDQPQTISGVNSVEKRCDVRSQWSSVKRIAMRCRVFQCVMTLIQRLEEQGECDIVWD
jgi:hypothetical protein